MPRDEALDLGFVDAGVRVGEEPVQAANAEAERVGRAVLVGRAERQDLPPALAGGLEPVDEAIRVGAEPARRAATSGAARSRSIERSSRVAVYRSVIAESHRRVPAPPRKQPPPRIQIQDVRAAGRLRPLRRQAHASATASTSRADVFKDGHDILARRRPLPAGRRAEVARGARCTPLGNDRWAGDFEVDALGRWQFTVEAWVDRFATLLDELDRKLEAEQVDLTSELSEARRSSAPARSRSGASGRPARPRPTATEAPLDSPLEVDVDRERARFGSWYELFPRSWGGFAGVEEVLPQLAELGFDVVYLPPIHPIGTTNRKGRNNALVAEPGDPGSPWAIGGPEGGHDAIHPELGTLADFDALVAAARELGLEIALDFAIQCSPDHPVADRAPGVVQPPARRDAQVRREPAQEVPGHLQRQLRLARTGRGSGTALRDVVLLWCRRGVRVFRVDNPHTKPVPFWEWLIAEVRGRRSRT